MGDKVDDVVGSLLNHIWISDRGFESSVGQVIGILSIKRGAQGLELVDWLLVLRTVMAPRGALIILAIFGLLAAATTVSGGTLLCRRRIVFSLFVLIFSQGRFDGGAIVFCGLLNPKKLLAINSLDGALSSRGCEAFHSKLQRRRNLLLYNYLFGDFSFRFGGLALVSNVDSLATIFGVVISQHDHVNSLKFLIHILKHLLLMLDFDLFYVKRK